MGTREALGLPNIGFDALSPTLRSGLTEPRHTTSFFKKVICKYVSAHSYNSLSSCQGKYCFKTKLSVGKYCNSYNIFFALYWEL